MLFERCLTKFRKRSIKQHINTSISGVKFSWNSLYSHFKSTSVISVIENKTAMSCSDDEEEKRNDYDVTSFQDRYSTATIPRTSIIRDSIQCCCEISRH